MIDFRYHALSLVAVFLALGIGIVLGVTIGDDLVSETDKNLRENLREDVLTAREEAAEQGRLADLSEEALREVLPPFAVRRLDATSVGLVAIGDLPADVQEDVDEAVGLGGARLRSQTIFRVPDDLDELADALGMVIPVNTEGQAERLGRKLARAIAAGRVRRLRRELPREFSGNYRVDLQKIVLYRDPSGSDDELRPAFEDGLVGVLGQRMVGVETMGTDPSQVEWYDDHTAASVDNVDLSAGKLALVLALERDASASYGFKDSADRPLPELSAP